MVGIFDAVSVAGIVDKKLEKMGGVEGTAYRRRREFIHRVPPVVVPEVAIAADVERRDMRGTRAGAFLPYCSDRKRSAM